MCGCARFLAQLGRKSDQLLVHAHDPASENLSAPPDVVREARITAGYSTSDAPLDRLGELTTFNCPECEGPLWEIDDGDPHLVGRNTPAFEEPPVFAQRGLECRC